MKDKYQSPCVDCGNRKMSKDCGPCKDCRMLPDGKVYIFQRMEAHIPASQFDISTFPLEIAGRRSSARSGAYSRG